MTRRSLEELEGLKKSLSEMLDNGMTQSQMADRLSMTKNQVAGLISRMLRGYKSRKINLDWKPELIEEARREMTKISTPSLPERVDEMPITNSDLSFDPPDGKLNVYNVKALHCRFLDNDGFFCGESISKASYCEKHYKLCYMPVQRKAKKWRNYLPNLSANFV